MNTDSTVKVSILCSTFNQSKYIKHAIDSFLMQKTNFSFEILIHDDASTDGTQEIIKEYAKKYPDQIKPYFQKENQYSKGMRNMIMRFLLPNAKGAYIALCEGDDYWTDPHKLQSQADFLDKNNAYSLCFHPVRVVFEGGEEESSIFPEPESIKEYTTKELLKNNFIQTNSVMYRKHSYEDISVDVMPGDWYLHLYHSRYGEIGFIDKVMSVYRRHPEGIWWKTDKNSDQIWRTQGLGYLFMFTDILRIFGNNKEYKTIIEAQMVDMFNRLIAIDQKYNTTQMEDAIRRLPNTSVKLFMLKQNDALQVSEKLLEDNRRAVKRLLADLSRSMEEVRLVKGSRSFVVGYLLLHPWHIPRRVGGLLARITTRLKVVKENHKDLKIVNAAYADVEETIQKHQATGNKTAVIIHLYYPDLWQHLHAKLKNMGDTEYDLYVSLPFKHKRVARTIKEDHPNACIVYTPNRGRDVLPFVKIMGAIQPKGYEAVLKMHSKKSKHRNDGQEWFEGIVDNLLPANKKCVNDIISRLNRKDTGLLGPEMEYIALPVNYEANKKHLLNIIKTIKSQKECDKIDLHRFDYGFFAGTMFWARVDSIQSVISHCANPSQFDSEKGQIDNTYAHAVERAFSLIPELEGRKMYSIGDDQVNELDYSTDNIPKWSDVYMGPQGED